jgi:hypothetical protein
MLPLRYVKSWAKTGLRAAQKERQDLDLKARHTAPTPIGYR